MRKVLIITVGGSPQPIITSIKTLKPDRTIFLCSDRSKSQVIGQDKPCEIRAKDIVEKLPNLPTYFEMGERFHPDRDLKIIEDPDDPAECYRCASGVIRDLISGDDEIMADYTGGTKTMSLSLGMAAMDYGVRLYLTTAARRDLIRVSVGESTEMISTSLINVERKLEQFLPMLLKQHDYTAVISQLESLLLSYPLAKESKSKIRKIRDVCRAFEAWDQFQHEKAWNDLNIYLNEKSLKDYGLFLKRVMQSRADIDPEFTTTCGIKGHGYEIVQDLILNADRRAVQHRFDDAVGRLYRALELLVQIHLKVNHGVKTANVDLDRIPAEYRPEFDRLRYPHNNNEIRLSLRQSYNLLGCFENDLLTPVYKEFSRRLEDVLCIRNNSLFAHGFNPISESDYKKLSSITQSFIMKAVQTLSPDSRWEDPLQFPTELSFT